MNDSFEQDMQRKNAQLERAVDRGVNDMQGQVLQKFNMLPWPRKPTGGKSGGKASGKTASRGGRTHSRPTAKKAPWPTGGW
jgi:hypothetical protein